MIILAIVVVVIVAIVALEYRSATLVVTVMSNHITNVVAYILTVDGRQVDSGTLNPGQSVQASVSLAWWVDNCQTHTIVATSSGGALGPETDSAAGIACAGDLLTATLSV